VICLISALASHELTAQIPHGRDEELVKLRLQSRGLAALPVPGYAFCVERFRHRCCASSCRLERRGVGGTCMRRMRMFGLLLLFTVLGAGTGAQSRETLWFGLDAGADFPLLDAATYLGTGGATRALAGARIPAIAFLLGEVELGVSLQPVTGGKLLSGISALGRVGMEFPQGGFLSGSLYGLGGYLEGILIGANPFSRVAAGAFMAGGGAAAHIRVADSWSLVAGGEVWTAAGLGPFIRGYVGTRYHPVIRSLKPLAYELRELSALAFSGTSVVNLFPVLYEYYETRPIGVVTLTNTSSKPLVNLRVSFLVEDYMKAATPCVVIDRLAPGVSVPVDLHALFSEQVLSLTERTRITAKLLFDYTVAVWSLHQEVAVPMSLHARNEITWDDDRRAAAFVNNRDPAVLQFGRNTATWVESVGAEAVNANLRQAMGVFEALRLYGMTYVVDPSSPYNVASAQTGAVDFLQFPRETLLFSTGDCDDLSILYCAIMQSLNIETAFLTIPGHIYAAVGLGMTVEDARRIMSRPADLISRDGQAWLPVEVTALGSSFTEAWALGASEWREAEARGATGFFPVSAAWTEYKPVSVPGEQPELVMPSAAAFQTVYGRVLSAYVAQEILPFVRELSVAVSTAKDKPPVQNRLGVLYARYGMTEEALAQFNEALKAREYMPAMVNKANLLFLGGSWRDAQALYQRVLVLKPDTPAALLGLARCFHALRMYAQVAQPYDRLKKASPELAARFPYLDPAEAGSTRAAKAGGQGEVPWEYGE
jgi:tetratricopeptide (TPR) repeat protein